MRAPPAFVFFLVVLLAGGAWWYYASRPGPAETAGQKLDEALDKAGEIVDILRE